MNKVRAGRALPVLLITLSVLTACWFGLIRTGRVHPPLPVPTHAQIQTELGTFAKLAKSLKPLVVNIAVEKSVGHGGPEDQMRRFFEGGAPAEPKARGQGSGVIISTDGFILTNNHVVAGADQVRVTTSDGRERKAKVVGTDPKTDLALVKVEATGLPAAQLGDSDALQVGDWVMAIGNPFGLEATVTVGVLSGKGRVIGAGLYDDFLQTDASINPGNSGGPLFNLSGQVVGINTAILPNGQGIGFSIPVNMAKDVVTQLKSSGRVVRGYLGVGIQPLTPQLKEALKLPAELEGALVSSVQPDSPANRAGVKVMDVITSINGRAVHSDRELLSQVARTPVDSEAHLGIAREGSSLTATTRIVQRPDDEVVSAAPPPEPPAPPRQNTLGFRLSNLTPDLAAQLNTADPNGVVIMEVERESAAARAGLRPGDVVRRLGTTEVHNTDDFIQALSQGMKSEAPLALLIERQGNTVFVVLES